MQRLFIGIDPGASGGIAVISGGGIEAIPMPATERDLWEYISLRSRDGIECFAIIEKVQGFIGVPHPGSAMFVFGKNVGFLRGCLIASGIPFDEATPQRWQKALAIPLRKRTESRGQWKNRLKAKAQQLYPATKVTLKTSDALLLATYCQRRCEGTIGK